ncbi:hypothetical protein JCM17960_12140 [Magnetospira thiophila]
MLTKYEDFVAFSKAYAEAVTASSAAAKAGAEAITKSLIDLTNAGVARTVAQTKALSGLKTPEALIKAQTKFATESLDQAYLDGKALADLSGKVAQDVSAPLAEHVKSVWALFPKAA